MSSLPILQAAIVWSPAAQAEWAGDMPAIDVRVSADRIAMSGAAPIQVELIARNDGIAVSPFLQATRGIAFRVQAVTGRDLPPREPIAISPPPPPLEPTDLTTMTAGVPLTIKTGEQARTIFPGPGTYQLRAVVFLMNLGATPVRHARLESAPIQVRVRE